MASDLQQIVNQTVKTALMVKDVVATELAKDIADDHPDLMREWGHELAIKRIGDMVRNACKAHVDANSQPLLPSVGDELPRAISVPGKGPNPTRFVSLARARVGELRDHVDMLTSQIEADTARRDALRGVLEECDELGAGDDDLVVNCVGGACAAE